MYPIAVTLHSPPSPPYPYPRKPLIYFLYKWICLLLTFHANINIQYVSFLNFLLEYSWFTMLVSGVQQSVSIIHIHICTLFLDFFFPTWAITEHWVEYMCLFLNWLLSLSIMFSRFIHDVACITTSFLYITKYCFIIWICQILFF